MPEIQAKTDTVSGADIAVKVETLVVGHFQSMEMTINWRTIEPAALKITAGKAHTLDIRGSQRYYDAGLSEWKDVSVRVSVKAVPKTLTLGTFEVGSATDTSVVYEVLYLKVF